MGEFYIDQKIGGQVEELATIQQSIDKCILRVAKVRSGISGSSYSSINTALQSIGDYMVEESRATGNLRETLNSIKTLYNTAESIHPISIIP